MELSRRSLLVYGLLAAVWLLVCGWQVQEHARVRNVAKNDLRNRSKDIANTARQSRPGILNLVVTRVDDSGVAVARS